MVDENQNQSNNEAQASSKPEAKVSSIANTDAVLEAIAGSEKRVADNVVKSLQKEAENKELAGAHSKLDGFIKDVEGNSTLETMLKANKKVFDKLSKEDRLDIMTTLEEAVVEYKQKGMADQSPSGGNREEPILHEDRVKEIREKFISGEGISAYEGDGLVKFYKHMFPDKFSDNGDPKPKIKVNKGDDK